MKKFWEIEFDEFTQEYECDKWFANHYSTFNGININIWKRHFKKLSNLGADFKIDEDSIQIILPNDYKIKSNILMYILTKMPLPTYTEYKNNILIVGW